MSRLQGVVDGLQALRVQLPDERVQARIDTLQNRLRLDALVGQLDTQRLQAVNNTLQP